MYKSVAEVKCQSGHQKRKVAVLLNRQGFSQGEPHGFHSTNKEIHMANYMVPDATNTPDASDAPEASQNTVAQTTVPMFACFSLKCFSLKLITPNRI